MIHVAHGIHDKTGDYSRHLCATIESYLSNTQSQVCVHILHDDTLTRNNKEIMKKIVSNHNAAIEFHSVCFDKFGNIDYEEITGNVTIGALFRLKLVDLLSNVDKVIYFDSDIICTLDLQEMWNIDLADSSIAAVADSEIAVSLSSKREFYKKLPIMNSKYFNSGVIIFNLNTIRKKHDMFNESINFLIRHKDSPMADQDALNFIFQSECRLIDRRFNLIAEDVFERNTNIISLVTGNLEDLYIGKCWHFAGGVKPWRSKKYPVTELYWRYFARTPWGDTPEKLIKWMYQIDIEPLEELVLTHRISSRKKFFRHCLKRLCREMKGIL